MLHASRWLAPQSPPMPLPFRRCLLPAAAAVLVAFAGCAHRNPDYDPAKPHHTPTGFRNLHTDPAAERPSFWRWQWERWRGGLPEQHVERVPRQAVDLAALQRRPGEVAVTWIGHSTALWQVAGLNVLTDPQFSERASPVGFAGPKREVPLPVALSALPRIDLVLVSHNHYDHLDRPTVLALQAQAGGPPLFVVPLGMDRWLRDQGVTRVKALDWWDRTTVPSSAGGVDVHLVPVQHWSSRTPWDRDRVLWGGFVLQAAPAGAPWSMFYSGDTGYSPDFAEIGRRFGGFDFAQIAVGCYLPRWFMRRQHVNEEEAVRIHQDVRSRHSIGVHWGTFRLCDDPVEAPLDGLPKAREALGVAPAAFELLAMGQTRLLRPATAAGAASAERAASGPGG